MATKENKEQQKAETVAPHTVTIENIMAYPYTKEGDVVGFIRRRIIGQTILNGKIMQVNGFLTERKGQ